jgi:hypothetical protein
VEASIKTRKGIGFGLAVSNFYHLCLTWNWEYDAGFVELLQRACDARKLSLLQITPQNLESTLNDLNCHELGFGCFFDRASDTDERFLPFVEWARQPAVKKINPFGLARRAWDKRKMNEWFKQAGLLIPETIILPAFCDQPTLEEVDLSCLGARFAIKPAHGGGGKGVHTEATSWEQIYQARQEFPEDHYMLQADVIPSQLGTRLAWFRVIYIRGQIFPCWWEPSTHVYTPISDTEEIHLSLQPLREITSVISRICRLDLFSTEIALNSQGLFLVIDPVNDPIDMRLQSRCTDGVPDEIVQAIAEGLADFAA